MSFTSSSNYPAVTVIVVIVATLNNHPLTYRSLNTNEQREFQQLAERRQMKDFMTVRPQIARLSPAIGYLLTFVLDVLEPCPKVTPPKNPTIPCAHPNKHPRCFDDCINDFTSKAVSTKEETCVNKCVDKFLKTSERLGQRFAEQNQAMMQGGGAGIGK